jgi:hypothetical protein
MKRATRKAQIEYEVYFDNLYCQNARMDIGREMDTEDFARTAALGALLLGLLLIAPKELIMFGFLADSEISVPGFGLYDWLFLAGLLIVAGVFAWIGFGSEFTGRVSKRNARLKPDVEKHKNIGRTGGGAHGGRK